jgi:3-oxoacyl-[acyl-carrier protein] reductase
LEEIPMTKLKGKVALVTGGGSGIGRGICHRLARDQADVVVNDIEMKSIEKVSKELESFGARALGICADVSLKSSVEEMVSRIIKEWNKIDILVNWPESPGSARSWKQPRKSSIGFIRST